jgi:RNAse (barnase) inhibitor barstar
VLTIDSLLRPGASWAHLAPGLERAADDLARSAPAGVVCRIVRGQRCESAAQLFREWGAALQFPSYFGHNWDAFEECLGDLEWLPGSAYVILVTNTERLLVDEPEQLGSLVDVLAGAAEEWGEVPFRVVFHSTDGDDARQRLRGIGLDPPVIEIP